MTRADLLKTVVVMALAGMLIAGFTIGVWSVSFSFKRDCEAYRRAKIHNTWYECKQIILEKNNE